MTTRGKITDAQRAFAEAFHEAERITALCHENPDADTIGGAVAVALIAQRLGKEWELVSVDPPAPAFDFLPLFSSFRTAPQLAPDKAFVCDAATLERVGRVRLEHGAWFAGAQLVNVDHHVTNSMFGSVNLVDGAASATCEVIAAALPAVGIGLDAELATALLTGIVRDSGGFSSPATSGETLRLSAELVDAGAPIALIHQRVLAELPFKTLALWGRVLRDIGERCDGRIVFATVTQDMLASTDTVNHDADGVVEFMARAKGADITVLLRETGPQETRVSLRVSEAVDATRIAGAFGGGGHTGRAGCTIHAAASQAEEQLLAVCERVLREAD